MNEAILNKASQLPEEPGVYIFKNEKDDVVYVGKAKKLKRRSPLILQRINLVKE